MTIYNSTCPNKISYCTSEPLPDSISVTYINYVCTLTTNYYPPQVIHLYYDYLKPHHTIMSDNPFYGKIKRWYFSRIHNRIIFYTKLGSIAQFLLLIRCLLLSWNFQKDFRVEEFINWTLSLYYHFFSCLMCLPPLFP